MCILFDQPLPLGKSVVELICEVDVKPEYAENSEGDKIFIIFIKFSHFIINRYQPK